MSIIVFNRVVYVTFIVVGYTAFHIGIGSRIGFEGYRFAKILNGFSQKPRDCGKPSRAPSRQMDRRV